MDNFSHYVLNPSKPRGNCIDHLLSESVTLHSVFMGFVWFSVERTGEVRGAYNILVGRPEGRRPLGGPMRRWEDNIKMDLR
jgi:hypothetical protein